MLRYFENDDGAYLEAIRDQPNGFVGNLAASFRPDYLVIHKAGCRTITPESGTQEPGAFTARQYRKVFGTHAEVLQWAKEKGFNKPRNCGLCLPNGNTSDLPRHPGAVTSPSTVTNETELSQGTESFWSGADPSSSHHVTFIGLLTRGTNFVSSADGVRMAPSRFVGYLGNSLASHAKRVGVDGGVTDAAISRILGERKPDAFLEEAYLQLCASFDIVPHKRRRKYWILRNPVSVERRRKDAGYLADFDAAVAESLTLDSTARKQRLAQAPPKPRVRTATVEVFVRNPDVVAEVLIRARGFCEICERVGPFKRASNGSPYLEVHHRVRLADGGDDTVENAVALCPNCHRQQHFG